MSALNKDIAALRVIELASERVLNFIEGLDEDDFLRDEMVKSATLMQLVVIGEYGSKVSDELRERFTEIEWQQMKVARNFYVHVYNYVDWTIVWDTVQTSIPELKKRIQNILEEISED